MYKNKSYKFLSNYWLRFLMLIFLAGLPVVSQSGTQVVVDEPFVVKAQVHSESATSAEVVNSASGRSQIYVVNDDIDKQLLSVVKSSSGRFLVWVYKRSVEFKFISTVSLMANGQVKLQVQFENSRPTSKHPYQKHHLTPADVYHEGRLHFWGHLAPSSKLGVTVIVKDSQISTIIQVNKLVQAFLRPVSPEDAKGLRRQALGQDFIAAVLSSNPPEFVEAINPAHALDDFFNFSMVPRECEAGLPGELSGVSYFYPIRVDTGNKHNRIFVRYSRGQNNSFMSGTQSLQLHRYAQGDVENKLNAAYVRHPTFMVSLLTANTPLAAEMAEQTYFLNLREVRAVPGVNAFLAREFLLDEVNLPVSSPNSVPPEAAGSPAVVTSEEGVTVLSGTQVPLMSAMAIASGGSEPEGSYLVNFGGNALSLLSPVDVSERLQVFKDLYEPPKMIMPIDHAGCPQPPPMIPVSIGTAAAASPQQNPEDGGFGSWLMFGWDEKKRNQEYPY